MIQTVDLLLALVKIFSQEIPLFRQDAQLPARFPPVAVERTFQSIPLSADGECRASAFVFEAWSLMPFTVAIINAAN